MVKKVILGWESGRFGIKGIKVRARGVILKRATYDARGVSEMRPADSTARRKSYAKVKSTQSRD